MVSKHAFLALLLATTLAGSASAASATKGSPVMRAARNPIVTNQNVPFDGPVTMLHRSGNRAIVAFWTPRGVLMVDLPVGTRYELDGMNEGPEGVDPLGAKEQGIRGGGPTTANSRTAH